MPAAVKALTGFDHRNKRHGGSPNFSENLILETQSDMPRKSAQVLKNQTKPVSSSFFVLVGLFQQPMRSLTFTASSTGHCTV